MARYTVLCDTCGQEMDFHTWGGNSRDRQWRADHWSHECSECKQKRVALENEKNAEKNRAMGLPTLVGSEKQIAWAETIRAGFIKSSSLFMEDVIKFYPLFNDELKRTGKKAFRVAHKVARDMNLNRFDVDFVIENSIQTIDYKITTLLNEKSASFWIENRGRELFQLLEAIEDEDIEIQKELEQKLQKEAEIEATVRPLVALSETVAYIFAEGDDKICVEFPEKREDFRTLVKGQGFSWGNGRWYRKLSITTGTKEDRIANIGNTLLLGGFVIRIFDEELRQKAIDGEYEPEHTRWILNYKGRFSIKWKRYYEDFYQEARKIPTSKWDNPTVKVKSEQFEAVLDFANEYDFRFTPKAQELLEEARAIKEAQLIPQVTKGEEPKRVEIVKKDFTPKEGVIDSSLLD